jgi:AMIN domain
MYGIRKVASTWALALVCVASVSSAQQSAEVQRVRVLNAAANHLEIEIQTSQPIAPRTQEVSDPTRLVVDFPQATPGPQLRAVAVNRGDVKGVRVGLFSSQPPTTRIVLDLGGPVNYQVLPSGKSVILKFGDAAPAEAAGANPGGVEAAAPEPPKPKVEVTYNNGQLHIISDRASLADVLNEIHKQTGAEVMVPPGADQEKVFSELGPAPPKEVLNSLLTGTSYNFILIGSSGNPNSLERVLVSNKGTSMVVDVGGAPVDSQPIAQPISATGRMPQPSVAAAQEPPEAADDTPPQQEPADTPPPDPQSADSQNNEQPPPPPPQN